MTEQMRQAMKERHTVRQFDGTPLTDAEKSILRSRVDELNKQYDLSIALIESEKSPLSFLGKTQGVPHKSKRPYQVSNYEGEAPEWFNNGVQAALLAPTALNMQAFTITGKGNTVSLTYKSGPMSGIDKGIVKHHFELGAGKENFEWA